MEDKIKEQRYLRFASAITFFEFIQEEFYKKHFDIKKYVNEIKEFEKIKFWSAELLSDFVQKYPKIYDVLQEIFQLSRFTNTQIVNFLFDVNILNSVDKEKQVEYLKKNLELDEEFKRFFIGNIRNLEDNKEKSIMELKKTIVLYLDKTLKNQDLIYHRLSKKELGCSKRFAKYAVENLYLNEKLEGFSIVDYLKNKRNPRDTKSIHGNFGTIKLKNILENFGIRNLDKEYDPKIIKTLPSILPSLHNNKIFFLTERFVEGVNKANRGKPKKFDFVIIKNMRPFILIETNYYSTSGTKIGINEDEYRLLNDEISKKLDKLKFLWITDGGYWLSPDGKDRLLGLMDIFEDRVLNYNLFKMELKELLS